VNYLEYTEADLEAAREQVADRAGREIERTEDRYEARLEKLYRELREIRGNRDVLSDELNQLRAAWARQIADLAPRVGLRVLVDVPESVVNLIATMPRPEKP
jgi:hypothetical protein